jgi:hypothetical protein
MNSLLWDPGRWPHLQAQTIACPCCGETVVWAQALDAFERLCAGLGAALRVNSGHRCALHNARVGGAPMSLHKRLAFDIALAGQDPARLLTEARTSGFTGFGFGRTFLHLDTRSRPAFWFYGAQSRVRWRETLSACGLPLPPAARSSGQTGASPPA